MSSRGTSLMITPAATRVNCPLNCMKENANRNVHAASTSGIETVRSHAGQGSRKLDCESRRASFQHVAHQKRLRDLLNHHDSVKISGIRTSRQSLRRAFSEERYRAPLCRFCGL